MGTQVHTKIIRFINTFEPVIPIYQRLRQPLIEAGYTPLFLLSQGVYRVMGKGELSLKPCSENVWVPRSFRNNKRVCALFYYLFASVKLFFYPANIHVFLTQPPLFYIFGAFLSKLRNVPYMIHVMDMYPEILEITGVIKPDGILSTLLNYMGRHAYLHADKIIVLGRCMKDKLVAKGIPDAKVQVLHNWSTISTESVACIPHPNPFRVRHAVEEKFVVMYSGNMGVAHELETLLRVAQRLQGYKDIVFLFVGGGTGRKKVETHIQKFHSDNVKIIDYQASENLPVSLSAADVHFISLRPGFEGLMVPSKLYGVLNCGKPVIFEGAETAEVARLIDEYSFGRIISNGDEGALEGIILELQQNQIVRNRLSERATFAASLFSEENSIKQYISIIKDKMNNG